MRVVAHTKSRRSTPRALPQHALEVSEPTPVAQAPADVTAEVVNAATDEQRHAMIAEVAYFLAEKRGFACGYELEDWLAAEAEINRRLGTAEATTQVATEAVGNA